MICVLLKAFVGAAGNSTISSFKCAVGSCNASKRTIGMEFTCRFKLAKALEKIHFLPLVFSLGRVCAINNTLRVAQCNTFTSARFFTML